MSNSARGPEGAGGAKRKLAAILSADVRGFSRLMGQDELGTHRTLTAHRRIMDGLIAGHGGRVVGTAGDSVLADFPSVVEALSCAVEIQTALRERNDALPPERRLEFRVGINLGDVIVDGADIYGDGVNVAARLQAIAPAGGVVVSGGVYDQVKNKLPLRYRSRGAQRAKNIAEPIRAYDVEPEEGTAARLPATPAAGARRWVMPGGLIAVVAAGAAALWLTAARDGTDPARQAARPPEAVTTPAEVPARSAVKPIVAVLPFVNLSGDSEQEYFSDGVTEDIISALSRFSHLLVMARNAVFPYKGQAVTPERLGRELGVRYAVEGSVRKAGERVRVTAQLSDAAQGIVLWSGRYDEDIRDIFEVQDEIVNRVAGALAINLTRAEQERAFSKPTDNLAAYDYVLRGRERLARRERAANVEGRELLRRAIELDPEYTAAHVQLGWSHMYDHWYGWTEWPDEAVQRAHDLAQTAIRLDQTDAGAHSLLAVAYLEHGRYELAALAVEQALELNPNDQDVLWQLGRVLLFSGQPDAAVRVLEIARQLDPNMSAGPYGFELGLAYYLVGRHEDAIESLERRATYNPENVTVHVALAAAYAEAGRMEDAERAAASVRRLYPFFEVSRYGTLFRNPEHRERVAEGLRKAGLE